MQACGNQAVAEAEADVMAVQVGDGVFEVLSTSGDTHLGGDDFDKRIVDFMADDFKRNEVGVLTVVWRAVITAAFWSLGCCNLALQLT